MERGEQSTVDVADLRQMPSTLIQLHVMGIKSGGIGPWSPEIVVANVGLVQTKISNAYLREGKTRRRGGFRLEGIQQKLKVEIPGLGS